MPCHYNTKMTEFCNMDIIELWAGKIVKKMVAAMLVVFYLPDRNYIDA